MFGSGSDTIGSTPELQAAIARRGSTPAINQVSQSAPTFNPQTAQPQQLPPSQGTMSVPQAGAQGVSSPSSEAELIIKALSGKLASESKIKEATSGVR